jgi:hypothetical protein
MRCEPSNAARVAWLRDDGERVIPEVRVSRMHMRNANFRRGRRVFRLHLGTPYDPQFEGRMKDPRSTLDTAAAIVAATEADGRAEWNSGTRSQSRIEPIGSAKRTAVRRPRRGLSISVACADGSGGKEGAAVSRCPG